jgi:hypothetical protein
MLRTENAELRRRLDPPSPPAVLPCVAGRILLISAIRNYWSYFFRSLNAVWSLSMPAMAVGNTERAELEFRAWREDVRICDDNPWIITDVVRPTLEAWTKQPTSPNAQLHPTFGWYAYAPSERLPEFVYTVRAWPKPEPGEDAAQSIERFAREQEGEFTNRLRQWQNVFRAGTGDFDKGMMAIQAKWTAQFVGGATPREIADHQPRLRRNRKVQHPDKYVRSEIGRFAARVALKLPER